MATVEDTTDEDLQLLAHLLAGAEAQDPALAEQIYQAAGLGIRKLKTIPWLLPFLLR
jgi:hypothetical protein